MLKFWLSLFVGILSEVAGTTGMRALAFDHPLLSQLSAAVGIVIAYFCVSRSVERIPMGVAYAIWSGVGTGGISLMSFLLFAEPMPPLKIFGLACIIAGMIVIDLKPKEGQDARPA